MSNAQNTQDMNESTTKTAMHRAMISRMKRLKMNRDTAANLETWGDWNRKLEKAADAYNNL